MLGECVTSSEQLRNVAILKLDKTVFVHVYNHIWDNWIVIVNVTGERTSEGDFCISFNFLILNI